MIDNNSSTMTLADEVLAAVKKSRHPVLVGQVFNSVTKTKHHCRVRQTLCELEKRGEIFLVGDGWKEVKDPVQKEA